jgi:hypothetical protein
MAARRRGRRGKGIKQNVHAATSATMLRTVSPAARGGRSKHCSSRSAMGVERNPEIAIQRGHADFGDGNPDGALRIFLLCRNSYALHS